MTEQFEQPSTEEAKEIKQEWKLSKQEYDQLLERAKKHDESLTELLNRLPAKEKPEMEPQPETEPTSKSNNPPLTIVEQKPESEEKPQPKKSKVQSRKRQLKWNKRK